ncbi:hypothetical protein HGRIS_012546 [Hohenbuehelia grisea]|uniref:3'-5' exonuclease domain-containing protein n=1 Tax=Hohenbuehelia grisea TaxID=104357 RepID=A0ABR3ISN5_9AGAR
MSVQGLPLKEKALLAARHRLQTSPARVARPFNGRTTPVAGVNVDKMGKRHLASKNEEGPVDDSFEIGPVIPGLAPYKSRPKPQVSPSSSATKQGSKRQSTRISRAPALPQKPIHSFFLQHGAGPSQNVNLNQTRSNSTMSVVNALPPGSEDVPIITNLTEQLTNLQVFGRDQQHQTEAPPPLEEFTSSQETASDDSLPTYSYKDWDGPPVQKYVRTEERANEYRRTAAGTVTQITHRTAVIQVCDEHMILVIQLSQMQRFPQKLKEIIESESVAKMGANILNDGKKLFKDYGVAARNLVELGALAREADPDGDKLFITKNGKVRKNALGVASLAKVVARYCGMTLEKPPERTSNWENILTQRQLDYAANDVHSGLMAYLAILQIASQHGRSLDAAKFTRNVHSLLELDGIDGEDSQCPEVPSEETAVKEDAPHSSTPLVHPTMRRQYWRAYRCWHLQNMPLDKMSFVLRVDQSAAPLKASTVISYVVGALQSDESLQFDMKKLCSLVQVEPKSWSHHRTWIVEAAQKGRGKTKLAHSSS